MTPSKKNKGSSNLKKALFATCFFILVVAVVIFVSRYHSSTTTAPQQGPTSIQKPTSDTTPPESPDSRNAEEASGVREHQLQEADRQFLVEKGLHDPIRDLVKDLMKHNELIPCEGSVGGTPGFYNPDRIAVLSKDHVIADYDDGHVEGTIELTFIVSQGTISWTVVHSECGN